MEAQEAVALGKDREHTVATLFREKVREGGDAVALREKHLGIWRSISWREFGARARALGLGLVSLGLELGDKVCVLSENNPEWLYADFGAICAGGVVSGIYPTDAPNQVAYIVENCEAKFLFVEDDEQLDKALEARDDMPNLIRIIVFDMEGLHELEDALVMSLDDLFVLGETLHQEDAALWDWRIDQAKSEDLAILVYTSGTTGPPKGAMISHHNLIYQAVNFTPLLPAEPGDDRLSFLPLCHIAERGMAYISLYARITTNFAESVDTVAEDLREVQPRAVVAVPRIWEKFYSAITIAVGDATWLQKLAYGKAIEVGLAAVERELEGQKVPLGLRIKRKLAYWLVLKNIRRMIGVDRCKWLATGAAPIAPDLIKWYLALGLPMLEAYGQTESAGIATLATPDAIKLGTVGRTVPHAEIRISDEGEILIGGDIVFMGYYRNPEKTAETIRDGWLHTGDVGSLDNQGYVRITDRMKDIIITAGGKNITPSEIENQLKFSPYISDAVVIGDGRKFLSCLIMIDHDTVVKYAQDNAVPFTNFASLTRALEVVDLINAEVEAVNTKFARVETIKTFRLIDQQLDPEDEELTPTMKLKRSFVSSKYKTLIDEMYQAA
ncbi:MAG: long-chain fatty acid--CoA ligase [Alphaproteobacteria bacterium]|jgi:long-chain acyl-CoA synthetase|nr:long-chain fatty acid--CoA ligase [Alphaproteobacteria bacterium]MDP6238409.1 long-chain fatty acid--CoA ligase [Alphaproteobacteria bacterium]MDP7173597.1 long-chain fatty acid--CoA ligase [Alphaproteobacteria bacterium]MDP7233510.1 long-chain fatty acid--CoA ligase [Alphaproteobacteria bacterium]MDP7486719.1 long-chain fatty acid--CoA ligase [Alphaproteobacteria bacterium]|tara:strand:- start:267 stop:2102 length:1836 start_codon:yes stop_codon:yes gene_type:complete